MISKYVYFKCKIKELRLPSIQWSKNFKDQCYLYFWYWFFQGSNNLLNQQLMETEDLKNSLEQQLENCKRRLSNQVLFEVSLLLSNSHNKQ